MDKPLKHRTLIHIYVAENGDVEMDSFFSEMTHSEALVVNLRLDQIKLRLLQPYMDDFIPIVGDDDIEGLIDGKA